MSTLRSLLASARLALSTSIIVFLAGFSTSSYAVSPHAVNITNIDIGNAIQASDILVQSRTDLSQGSNDKALLQQLYQGVQDKTTLAATTIDDFEDGDTSDWGFFGGNNAGGGGGPAADRPKEGAFYFSTGWGGQGTISDFYGGAFKNFENTAQVTPPADPWLNFWVLNQSDATADQFRLEVTIREDLNGDGWTNGQEDSFRLDAVFTSAQFDDEWTLVSAPLSSLTDLSTGGDGTFDGSLDEVVIVIAGVQGADGSVVELDFDQFAFTSGGPLVSPITVFDDMEHGDPFGNGWFAFGGAVGGGGIGANNSDLPPSDGGAFSLDTGWGSGGNPGFYGGFGRTNPITVNGGGYFNFWINPNENQAYTLEINLQEDDNGDGVSDNGGNDDEFQYNCEVGPAGPCAVAGGGWQLVSIPLADFFDDNSFFNGGNGVFDPVSSGDGGNGELISIVFAVIGSGSDANFRTDYWVFSDESLNPEEPSQVIDDFESGLAEGIDADALPIGFVTFSDGSPISIVDTETPPTPVPGFDNPNTVLAMTGDVTAFAGFYHAFENEAVDTWVTQDWSAFEGIQFWFLGQNSGTTMFVDVIENRSPGSTSDDAERHSVSFVDDFTGWQQLRFPFSSFTRKEIGNGAPNDGFSLTQIHGWALGMLATPGEVTFYIDHAELYGTAVIPDLSVTFAAGGYPIDEGDTGTIQVALNRPMNSSDPAQVSVAYTTEDLSAVPNKDYIPTSGVLTFINGGPSELSFDLTTLDDSKFQGTQTVGLVLEDPVDVALGFITRATAFILNDEAFDPNLEASFENGAFLWNSNGVGTFSVLKLAANDSMARPGQDALENVLSISAPMSVDIDIRGRVCPPDTSGMSPREAARVLRRFERNRHRNRTIVVVLYSTDTFDATTVDHTTVMLGGAKERRIDRATGEPRRVERDVNRDGKLDLVFKFNGLQANLSCDTDEIPFSGLTFSGEPFIAGGGEPATFSRDFADSKDWSQSDRLTFWMYGKGSGAPVTVQLKDNRAPDPGPAGWQMVWNEEFNEPAGTPPNPENWTFEIGDGSVNGIPGWGNDELQYYTDDPANASTDGQGNMVLTVREADGSLQCYYGPCEYTSARLISKEKAEFAYGRIESRILVPEGVGIWPAFWSLGTDIDVVNWPQTGEIDFMEFVGRLPNEIFGTIHGPGYAGGASYGNIYDFGEPVFNNYHTFTVEWEPDLIRWYVDGILYHTATPGDVAPNEWVFNDAIFMLLNVAIGGNFGGAVDPNIQLPASMKVDYIRVYQGPDSAERFEATVNDDFVGWQKVEVPFSEFSRSAEQPAGAPDDGLNLTEVWGYGFALPQGGSYLIDEVRVESPPAPPALTVMNTADSGVGSLRQTMLDVAAGGVVSFDPSLAGQIISLSSGQLTIDKDLIIDGSAAPGIVVSGANASRVLQVNAGKTVSINDLTIADGVAAPQGGGILNLGTLSLGRVTVRNNTESSGAPANFAFGGGGIYNGDGATLNLLESTVADNATLNQPGGGIFGFFNSNINITDSTVSGNVGGDVAGGLRSLGNANIVNSTFSGNVSTAWHGGGIFHTDGTLTVDHSTFAENVAPAGTASGILVATFGAPASMTVSNSVLMGNGGAFACAIEGGGAATITSAGGNVIGDGSCNPDGVSDQSNTDALLGPLTDNGGGTQTHALGAGSPAIDAATGACPDADQRGVARPQGAACDSGAYELAPF